MLEQEKKQKKKLYENPFCRKSENIESAGIEEKEKEKLQERRGREMRKRKKRRATKKLFLNTSNEHAKPNKKYKYQRSKKKIEKGRICLSSISL